MKVSKPKSKSNLSAYRLVRRTYDGKPYYLIMEIWYNDKGEIDGWVDDPHPFGETIEELKKDVDLFKKAISREPLDYDEFSASGTVRTKLSRS